MVTVKVHSNRVLRVQVDNIHYEGLELCSVVKISYTV